MSNIVGALNIAIALSDGFTDITHDTILNDYIAEIVTAILVPYATATSYILGYRVLDFFIIQLSTIVPLSKSITKYVGHMYRVIEKNNLDSIKVLHVSLGVSNDNKIKIRIINEVQMADNELSKHFFLKKMFSPGSKCMRKDR